MRTLLHLSDLHFGPMFQADVAAGLAAAISERHPDLVIVSGDLTQRAKPRQFVAAREWLELLAVPVVAVPGNHDVPMYRFWERFFAPYGAWRKHYREELDPSFQDEELLVVSINTAYNWTIKNGRVLPKALDRVLAQLRQAPGDLCRLVVAHHPLVPPPEFPDQATARGAAEALELLAAAGAELILGGHFHVTYLRRAAEYHGEASSDLPVLHTGSATSSRGREWEAGVNSCNWLSVESEVIRVQQLLWDGSAFLPSELRWELPRRSSSEEVNTEAS